MANTKVQPVLLSLKPAYANMVFGRSKTVELRRRIASYMNNRDVFIYVTSPAMELRGGFRVGKVWRGAPEYIWGIVQKRAGVDRQDFDNYFEGQTSANAIEITEIWEYRTPISLATLRDQLSTFMVPQSWRYVREDEQLFLQTMERKTRAFTHQHPSDIPLLVPQLNRL